MRATVLSAALAAAFSFGAATAEAQSANISATATVLSALNVTGAASLAFGNVTPGVNKTVAIADAGAGRFDVVKAANSALTLSFTLPSTLSTGGGATLPIGTFTGAWNTSATTVGATAFTPASGTTTASTAGTTVSVYLGATVSPAAAQAAGSYTGTVTMSAVYF
jgi:Domain of unknown function (DUF4402)